MQGLQEVLFPSFEGRGGRQDAHYCLERNMWPKWRCVQQLEAGDSPREPHPSQEESFLSADRHSSLGTALPSWESGESLCPKLQGTRGCPHLPTQPAARGQCHCHRAVGRESSMDSDSSWVRDNVY